MGEPFGQAHELLWRVVHSESVSLCFLPVSLTPVMRRKEFMWEGGWRLCDVMVLGDESPGPLGLRMPGRWRGQDPEVMLGLKRGSEGTT